MGSAQTQVIISLRIFYIRHTFARALAINQPEKDRGLESVYRVLSKLSRSLPVKLLAR
jgi:hypothetical protein